MRGKTLDRDDSRVMDNNVANFGRAKSIRS